MEDSIRSGFVAVVGCPNVGKSSLTNALVGEKVVIVSDKPQTTRNRIMGIVNRPGYQMILLDTPGMHLPQTKLGKLMESTIHRSMKNVECILFVLDGARGIRKFEQTMLERLAKGSTPFEVVINKMDLLEEAVQNSLKEKVEETTQRTPCLVSALRGVGMPQLLDVLFCHLPLGPLFFPADEITDMPEEFLTVEIIREKALLYLHEEVPHGIGVELERFMEREDGVIQIEALLYCEKESHKGIIIGKHGSMLKQISIAGREDLEELFGARVYLRVFVKVREDWRNNAGALKDMGYE